MKKIIKKTIAGLIAGVMAISSMPFTALADTASDKAFIQSKIDSGAPTYATTTSTSGNALSNNSGYMNNILVSGNYNADVNSTKISFDSGSYYSIVGHALNSVVAIYDGVNAVKIPVSVEAKNAHTNTSAKFYTGIDHVALKNGGQFSLGNGTWIRANSWVDYGDNSDTSHDFSTDDTFNTTRGTSESEYFLICYTNVGFQKPQTKQWKNYITFTPDSSFDKTYYASLTTLAYKCQADTYATWPGNKGNKQDIAADTSDYTVDYKVINYKPLKDLLDDVDGDLKNTFNAVSANESGYDASTVSAYYSALAELYRFNLTDGLTVDTVAKKAEKMKTLISNYNTAKGNLKELPKIDKSNIEAYEAALKEANAKVSEANNYTAESIDALQKVIAEVVAQRENVKTNEDLDALTARLLTAVNNLNKKQLTVKLQVVGKSETPEEKESKTINYGETYTSLEGAIGETQNVKKWVVETNDGQTFTTLNTFDKVVNVVITEDTTIKAYLSDDVVALTSTKVTFLGRHNKVVAIKYVTGDEPFKTDTVTVPELPFYTSNGWDTATVECDGKEHIVRATYTAKESEQKCTVHFNGKDKEYTYNSYVYLFDAVKGNKYALYADADYKELLVVLDGVDFYTPQREHIYVKEYTGDAEANVAVMGSFATTETSETDIKYVANFNCKFNIPADAKAVDWGVILENSKGVQKPISIKEKSERNEYTVRIKVSKKVKVNACAYVTYKKADGTTVTKKSGFVTVDLNTL